ncbi:MAG: hypothetical protein J6M16_03825 [Clostridia bacterium]|nr:hypothetical protein [Clostridia bacterium]
MNETSAWQKFYKSGKIADYLAYTNVKERPPEENFTPKEENENVYNDRRSSYKGTDNR